MNPFKGRHFQVTSFCGPYAGTANTGISYRELQEMLAERGSECRSLHDLPLGSALCA